MERKGWLKTNLSIIFILFARKNLNCLLFMDKGNVMIAELPARVPINYVGVRSFRKFAKHCLGE
jgi:hypothetical protein